MKDDETSYLKGIHHIMGLVFIPSPENKPTIHIKTGIEPTIIF